MTLTAHYDSNGRPQSEFTDLRETLLGRGRTFSAFDLTAVPYEQLPLCIMANAGAAGCDLAMVRTEKQGRRQRFVSMSPDEFPTVKRYLQAQGMYSDVLRERELRAAPHWDTLSPLQKIWFKSSCLLNHIDEPSDRLKHIESLLFRAGDHGLLPISKASQFVDVVADMVVHFPRSISADSFRAWISGVAQEMLQMMPDIERDVCAHEILRGFSCTSDCFQPILAQVIS